MAPPNTTNSPSGLIRKRMGPRLANLKRLITDARQLLKQKPTEDQQSKSDLADVVEENTVKMETTVEKMELDNKEWLELIGALSDEDKPNEEALYSYWATENDDQNKNFVFLIDDASSIIKILKLKMERLRPGTTSDAVSGDHDTSDASGRTGIRTRRSAKLRTLELPIFNGDPLTFKEFWALFSATVDQEDYDAITKFSYLRQQLRGTARDAIAGLEVSEENYGLAVQLLRERFEKTTPEIIGTLYSKLKMMPRCSDHHQSLRRTYDAVQKIIRQLTNIGVDMSSNQLLVMDVLAKFPESVVKEITMRKNVDIRSTVEDTEKAIEEYIEQTELLSGMVTDLKPLSGYAPRYKEPYHNKYEPKKFDYNSQEKSERNISANRSEDNSAFSTLDRATPKRECVFCGEAHFHSECPNYRSRKARQKRIDEIGNCERCLCHGHSTIGCRTRQFKIRCFVCKAIGLHSSPFCPKLSRDVRKFDKEDVACHSSDITTKTAPSSYDNSKTNKSHSQTKKTVNALSIEESSLLSTALGVISNPLTGQRRKVRLIFDNCSHRSYLKQSIVDELQLPEQRTGPLKVSVFGSEKSVTLDTKLVDVCVHLRDGTTMNVTVNSTPIITSCVVSAADLPEDTKKLLRSMKPVLADDFETAKDAPEFLIGADLFWDFITGTKLRTSDGIYLIPTSLGIVLGGCYKTEPSSDRKDTIMLCLTERNTVPGIETALSTISWESRAKTPPDIHDFWSLETIGITDDPIAKDDDLVMENFKETVHYENGRYEVEWPWRDNYTELPTNYGLALGRLKSLLKRFQETDSTLPQQYSKIFEEQVDKEIIEKVPDEEITLNNVIHYLAHHAVTKENHLTTKVRIVFDGSARCGKQEPSLNECLMRGPVILPDLCTILIRFRLQQIAIISDLEKAFHQIALKKSQRDAVRFLWLKDGSRLQTNNNLQMYRFQRVPFGTISSPFLLGATILHHLQSYDSPIAKRIAANMYVDNCITGVDTEEEALKFYHDSKTIFRAAGMNLREFCTNSEKLHQTISKEDQCNERVVKVLGMKWDSNNDILQLTKSWNKKNTCSTKRGVLKATASLFDPLGYFQPVTMQMKCFIRDLWNVKSDWDDGIPKEFVKRWEQIQTDVKPAFEIALPRFIGPINSDSAIITFTDASQEAYAATVYLRTPVADGWLINLLFSKSRIAPKIKWKENVTIPRLELLGLTIGVRLSTFVRQSLMSPSPLPVHLFCDSTCVLNWIRSTKTMDRFTTNRVKQIRSIENASFRYIKSEENPADLATRGVCASELRSNEVWWHGPNFLKTATTKWPEKKDVPTITSTELQKMAEKPSKHQIHGPTLLAGEGSEDAAKWTPCGLVATRNSSLQKMLRITVLCLKFLKTKLWSRVTDETAMSQRRINRIFENVSCDKPINAKELNEARFLWVKSIQDECFSKVRTAIEKKGFHPLIREFNLQIDDRGLLRCCGRLSKADLPGETISPILIPKKHYVTRLIIKYVHHKVMHSGIRHTLAELRRQFWVPQGRQAVRSAISECLICKRFRGHEFGLPKMPPLPRERVTRAKPFQFTGLDFIGPINVRINEETKKGWICIFTCLLVRAIHLEWMIDCTVISFINALSRFISRRGTPAKIVSDNAAQFHLASDLFRRLWKQVLVNAQVLSYVAEQRIEWNFTTEFAPWQGGVYERLVGVVKNAMRTQIGRKLLSFDKFVTLLTEVEAIVNTRPITYVYGEFRSGQALRPMDFLTELPTGIPGVDPTTKPEGGEAAKLLIRHWKEKHKKLEQFWQLWHTEYLLSLRQRDDREHRNRRSALKGTPKLGEVVIVKNVDAPRGAWKLARITKLLKGNDRVIRSAELMMSNHQIIRRPINHLYSLELPSSCEAKEATHPENVEATLPENEFEGFDETDVEDVAELRRRFDDDSDHAEEVTLCSKSIDLLLNGLEIVEIRSEGNRN